MLALISGVRAETPAEIVRSLRRFLFGRFHALSTVSAVSVSQVSTYISLGSVLFFFGGNIHNNNNNNNSVNTESITVYLLIKYFFDIIFCRPIKYFL